MLDDVTKRRIDSARDILVGKVPVPSSQVEQITIALIYKFMDDMDKESVSMGGKSSFFSGAYKKYAWSNIFDPRLGGFELINLYGEAIAKLNQNPNIPQLFRDIFKNAYLPYRDPETLKLFLKTINEFSYDHSEDLGDAFEYLLSVLDSQGDAGQFRTPRHIIDFMVAVVDPKKQETIIDPACGTAGFLISSYKHIRKANTATTKAVQRPGDLLTPTERKKLLTNFKGYDISPDMVRLSLVNLYLHGFVQPQIYEYDTLTSEDRWNEYADVILANPPFMSPKGGIIPHKRFSVQSKRSEVLFVDYIAEHLTPTGRAAVIVPEGIIFQSGGAYKQLRKMLLEKYLYGVVSLPAGVFNPYSGVKTSILLLDRGIASKSDAVLFVKIENDGLALGAQRREIDKNDLPDALKVIRKFQNNINHEPHKQHEHKEEEKPQRTQSSRREEKIKNAVSANRKFDVPSVINYLVVSKDTIAENGEYNLTGERYRVVERRGKQKWPMVRLGDVCELVRGITYTKNDEVSFDGYKVLRANNINVDSGMIDLTDVKQISKTVKLDKAKKLYIGDIFICLASGSKQHVGKVALVDTDMDCYFGGFMGAIRVNDKIIPPFLFAFLRSPKFNQYLEATIAGANINNLGSKILYDFEIPLPPLEVQQKIAREIEGYQKVIDGARQVVDSWKPQIGVDPEWPMVRLGDAITLQRGYDLPKQEWEKGEYPIVGSNGVIGYHNAYKEIGPGVVTGRSGTIGKVHYISERYYWPHNTSLFVKNFNGNNRKFISYLLQSVDLKSLGETTSAVPSLDRKNAHRLMVQLPSLEVQEKIVAKIEAERKVVDGCRELMVGYEGKIKRVVDGVWGE
ncbi:hypothetical protein FACS1894130_08120 [Spirochaetia bacterium]|nr:hypothetical protein FACS1894130_08120 [Spirochaetia bacterium]